MCGRDLNVPGGTNDGSLARMAWKSVYQPIHPVGNGVIRGARFCSPSKASKIVAEIIPYPTGRVMLLTHVQALRAWLPSFGPYGTKSPTPTNLTSSVALGSPVERFRLHRRL